ncbi:MULTISPECIES: MBL fold metallo-hydrolase [Gordonia]|nr:MULTISPECIES: MBL fold metallo-hydrolase [Gordonia]MDF3280131.1 MBL fold metallo-hydrolase [Gordonia sp. N1V]UZF54118.1 MBL fold metallo-hydrolase [Gordonia polyisoprenivorans]WCB35364.1 MBL fold metallo-hydrolase [Gordonia polyisoprenivorans]
MAVPPAFRSSEVVMLLTKHTHATITVTDHGSTLLVDPGTFTPNAAELLADADAVVITHEHFDHFDVEKILAALRDHPELQLYGPASIAEPLSEVADQVHAISTDQTLDIAGFTVEAFVTDHAVIHPEIPVVDNIGFLIDGTVFHPGDAYLNPGRPITTLLLPVSGPWISTEQAIDYVRAVKPQRSIAIHDLMLSDAGKSTTGMFLGENSLTATPLETMELGESRELAGI